MREDIDVSKIKKGDTVRVSLDDLPVTRVSALGVHVRMPDGSEQAWNDPVITAHEPAAPALPDWWGSLVILASGRAYGRNYLVYDSYADDYTGLSGVSRSPEFFEAVDVTVIVDRDGNLPAAGMLEAKVTELAERNRSLSGELKIIRALPPAQEQAAAIVRDLKVERDDARKQVDFLSTAVRAEIDAAKSYEQERDQAREAYAKLHDAVEAIRDRNRTFIQSNNVGDRTWVTSREWVDNRLTEALGDNQ